MILKPITVKTEDFPAALQPYLTGARLYDSSSSPQAKVIFIDRDGGYFLKLSAAGALEKECEMTNYFHSKGLAARVVEYISEDSPEGSAGAEAGVYGDYLLTEKLPGQDCIDAGYLEQPERLCDTLAEKLFILHSLDYSGCPVQDHREGYLARVERNYRAGQWDPKLFSGLWEFSGPEEAYGIVKDQGRLLRREALLHGDYCLPNVVLKQWRLSGFIDLDSGGVGDRHVDVFWGAWSLFFNLGTDRYRRRFYDAYGRDRLDEDKMRLIAACEVLG